MNSRVRELDYGACAALNTQPSVCKYVGFFSFQKWKRRNCLLTSNFLWVVFLYDIASEERWRRAEGLGESRTELALTSEPECSKQVTLAEIGWERLLSCFLFLSALLDGTLHLFWYLVPPIMDQRLPNPEKNQLRGSREAFSPLFWLWCF